MSVRLQSAGSVITLPDPELGNSQVYNNEVKIGRAMTGVVYSYIKTKPQETLKYSFSLSRSQYFAFKNFYLVNAANPINMTNWKGETWIGYILSDLEATEKRAYDTIVDVEFEGIRLS